MKVLKIKESTRAEVLRNIHTVFKQGKRPTTTRIHRINLAFSSEH